MQPLELREQIISIHLPSKPFILTSQKILGKDIHLYLYFKSTEAHSCSVCSAVAGNHGFRPGKKPLGKGVQNLGSKYGFTDITVVTNRA